MVEEALLVLLVLPLATEAVADPVMGVALLLASDCPLARC
jgi:hypothetical protein